MSFEVLQGDARNLPLEADSVDLIITSPPYFALRSYRDDGEHYDGQIGSEPTPTEFLDALVECTGEMVRVLKPSGSIFVNLGDKYANPQTGGSAGWNDTTWVDKGTEKSQNPLGTLGHGVRQKSRMLLPHRYAIRCIDELGLICRMDMVWSKPNGLPESVSDRVRASHEYWFHLVKSPRYFTGIDEIRQPQKQPERSGTWNGQSKEGRTDGVSRDRGYQSGVLEFNPLGRLPGSVWNIPSEPLLIPDEVRETRNLPDHFAAFPQEWPRRLILGFSPSGICTECEQPRRPAIGSPEVPEGLGIPSRPSWTAAELRKWTAAFRSELQERGISNRQLDEACGTTGMAGHWTTQGSQPAIPTIEQWDTIVASFGPFRGDLDAEVRRVVWVQYEDAGGAGDFEAYRDGSLDIGDATNPGPQNMRLGRANRVQEITGYICSCATPEAPTRPAVVLDPFGGTGTTAGVAHTLGRHGITVDLSADYCRLAEWRIGESGHFAKSRQRMWADRQTQLL